MTNVLNSIIANQAINPSMQRGKNPAFTFNTDGKVKPLDDKAKLLPSKIFGSPVDYVKDLKQDIVNIGRAAKGKANDHELGRINDVAMKLGSLALASYLFCKTPGKLAKTMEFVGFGTFFGSMALWPKLAIQAPLRARTGVDIHRKYVDSQGRKKMLHQDPQYDLTDLYGQKDLELIGKKCKVNENLPDRERFIKQRANKIATQGNTLWMMTAGVAPIMSALACNTLEKPLAKTIEVVDLKTSQRAIDKLTNTGLAGGFVSTLKQRKTAKAIEKFLSQNANREIDEKLAKELSSLLRTSDASVRTAFEKQILALGVGEKADLTMDKVSTTLKKMIVNLKDLGIISGDVDVAKLLKDNEAELKKWLSHPVSLASVLASGIEDQGVVANFDDVVSHLSGELELASQGKRTLSEISGKVKVMQSSVLNFVRKKDVLDKFQSARIGQNADSYIAQQWNKISDVLIDDLGFTQTELKRVSRGEVFEVLNSKLAEVAKKPEEYSKLVTKFADMISDYEKVMDLEFTSTAADQMKRMSVSTNSQLASDGFDIMAEHFAMGKNGAIKKGTIASINAGNIKDRIAGAKSSFYRVLQTLDFYKRVEDPAFKAQVQTMLEQAVERAKNDGKNLDIKINAQTVDKYIDLAKKILFEATDTTYIEKLQTTGFENIISASNVSKYEFDVLMKMLFEDTSGSTVKSTLENKADNVVSGFKSYLNDMVHVLKKENPYQPKVGGYGSQVPAQGEAKSKEIGKQIINYFKDAADKSFNSKQWLKIWGVSFLAITAVTMISTLFIGKKGKMEKQVEQELKLNG